MFRVVGNMDVGKNGRQRRPLRRTVKKRNLDKLSDAELLDTRMRDLGLSLQGTVLEERIFRLYEELDRKGIRFEPHFWISDEWFTPDGIPGVAVPFYLAHPRLMRLEAKQMMEVEGGTDAWCMKILRHEAGHALDNAFRLRRRRKWREVFGRASQPYPKYYQPKPYSRSYVHHLDMWYAQSHPVEDFAETFAVWLKPRSRWRTEYAEWPALRKLEYVDELMREIRNERPKVTVRERVDSISTLRKTLREHYQAKREHYGIGQSNFSDNDLCRLFSSAPEHKSCPLAATFLRQLRPRLRKSVAYWTGEYQYTIDQVLNEMIERCRELKLRRHRPEAEVERDLHILLTVQTMNFLNGGHHRVAL